MSELNQYNFYSLNSNYESKVKEDKVDKYISELNNINEYEDVCAFVLANFGDVQTEKLFDFPELNKQIFILFKENAVEIFAAKNKNQFFSKGWKQVEKDKLQ